MNNCTDHFPSAHWTTSNTSEPQSKTSLWGMTQSVGQPSHFPHPSLFYTPSVISLWVVAAPTAQKLSPSHRPQEPGVLSPKMWLSSSTHSFSLRQVVINGVDSDQKPIYANYCLFSTKNKAFRDKRISEQICLKIFLSPKATVQSRPLNSWDLLFLQLILLTSVNLLREYTLSNLLRVSSLRFRVKRFHLKVHQW